MDLSRLEGGGTPFETNIAVAAAATIVQGVMLHYSATSTTSCGAVPSLTATSTTGYGTNAIGVTQIGTAAATADIHNVNGIGITRFNIGSDGIPNESVLVGSDWIPTLINIDARYYCSFSTATGVHAAASTGITASTGTVVTIVGLGDPGIPGKSPGGWIMDGGNVALSSAAGTPTYNGQLRAVTASGASSILSITTAMNVSTDSNLVFTNPIGYKGTIFSANGQLRATIGSSTAGALIQGYIIVDSLVRHDAAPMHSLRFWQDNGLNGLTHNVLFNELRCTSYYATEGTA